MSKTCFCAGCGRHFDGVKYTINGKNYCYDCYQQISSEKQKDEVDKQELYQYICYLFQVKGIPSEVIAAIERLIKNGKKIKAMKATLHYYYEIEGHPCSQILNIGYIIENNYEAARQHQEEERKIKEQNQQVDLNVPPVNVKISPGTTKKIPHRMHKEIKIEDL